MLKALRNKKTKMVAAGDLKGVGYVCGWCGSVEQEMHETSAISQLPASH
jgi:hypothetical protein